MKTKVILLFLLTLILVPSLTYAQYDQWVIKQDSLALIDIWNNLNGENWDYVYPSFRNWDQRNWWVVGWHGIGVNDHRVDSLDIGSLYNVKGTYPASIGDLTALRHLDIKGGTNVPNEIGSLIKLEHLQITVGNATTIPVQFYNFTNLKVLSISGSNLTGNIPAQIGGFSKLERLTLNGDFSGNIPKELWNLTNLKRLYIVNRELEGALPPELGKLTELESLTLYGNELDGNLPIELGNLKNLTSLHLANNNIEGTIPTELGNLTKLVTLRLGNNNLSGGIPQELGNLTSLEWLRLYGNDLESAEQFEIGNLTKLEQLYLDNNNLNFRDLEKFTKTNIKEFRYAPQGEIKLKKTVTTGATKLSMDAGGTQTSYQWFYNGVKVAGETTDTCIVQHQNDITKYHCEAKNSLLPELTLIGKFAEDESKDCWETGTLNFCLTNGKWEKGGKDIIKCSDIVSVNDFLYFDGTITIDTVNAELDAKGEFYVNDIPLPGGSIGKYTLSQGEYNLKLLGSDGKLTNFLNSKLSDSAELFGVGLNIDNLQLVMKHDTVGLKIGCTIAVPGISGSCEGSGDTDIKLNGLEITNAGISLGGVEIKDLGLFVDGYCLKDLSINYDSPKDILTSGMLLALPFGEVGGGFKLEEGLIDSIAWKIEAAYAPFVLGSTTIGIKGFFGHISNITKPAIEVELGGIFSDIISDDLYRIEASGKTVWPTYFEVKGTGEFLRPIFDDLPFQLQGEVALSYKIPNNLFAMEFGGKFGTIKGKDWLLNGKGNLKLGLNSDPPIISGMLNGAISLKKLPDYLPYSAFNQMLNFPVELQSANCLIIGKNELFFGTTSFQYGLFGPYSIRYTVDLSKRSDDEDYLVYQVDKGATKSGIISKKSGGIDNVTKTFVIPENTELAAIEINSQGIAPASTLIDNTGKKYTSSSSSDSVLNIKSSDSKQSFWLITSPNAGNWSVLIDNPAGTDTIITHFQFKEKDFKFSMNQTENTVIINWDISQVEEGQTVNIMLDDNDSDFDGFLVKDGDATKGSLSFILDESTPSCNYNLFVQLVDENSVVQAYAKDEIDNPLATLAPPENLSSEYNSETGEFDFTWTKNPTSKTIGYILSVTDELGNDSVYAILNSNQTSISLFIEDFETKSAKIESYNQDWKIGCPTTAVALSTSLDEFYELENPTEKIMVYPNPTTGSLTVRYFVENDSKCQIMIIDINGRQIAQPFSGFQTSGFHEVAFEYNDIPNGIYFIKFVNNRESFTVKSILNK